MRQRLPGAVMAALLALAGILAGAVAAPPTSADAFATAASLIDARRQDAASRWELLAARERTAAALVELAEREGALAATEGSLRVAVGALEEAVEDRNRALVDAYVRGGQLADDGMTAAVLLGGGERYTAAAVGEMYTRSVYDLTTRRWEAAREAEARARDRRDAAAEAVAAARQALEGARADEQQREAAVRQATELVSARLVAHDQAMSVVWAGVAGSWRCDQGGKIDTLDLLRVQLADLQRDQRVDPARAGQLLPPISAAANPTFTSGFGWRADPIDPGRRAWHEGIDLAAPAGTPVVAVASGTILSAVDAGDGYGIKVVIDHAGGLGTVYAHLSSVGVRAGQPVAAGETIGAVGSTGRSTGPHLHYELRALGAQCDPLWGWGA